MFKHESSRRHITGAHPERPERIDSVFAELNAPGAPAWEQCYARAATESEVTAVHPPSHLEMLAELAASGGGLVDADTVVSTGSLEAALHAAGGSICAVEAVLNGDADFAFALHRPPGHHAEPNKAMGFCLLSNAAIAVRAAVDGGLARRPLILDWDVHHGNGTEAVFSSDPDVMFISIHQSPLWPGTGDSEDRGTGAGRGATLNLPVPPGSGDFEFCSLVEHVVGPMARGFGCDLIVVSAGYDAHADDPLASCTVSDGGFAAMARSISRTARDLEAPLALVLEGGYDCDALARGVVATMHGLESPDQGVRPAESPLSSRAMAGLELPGSS